MTTGRPSGFKEYLCGTKPGPADLGYDGCRRYLYDDSQLLTFNAREKPLKDIGAVFDAHAEDPEHLWRDWYATAAAGAEEIDRKHAAASDALFGAEAKEREVTGMELKETNPKLFNKLKHKYDNSKLGLVLYWTGLSTPYHQRNSAPLSIAWAHSFASGNQTYDTLLTSRCFQRAPVKIEEVLDKSDSNSKIRDVAEAIKGMMAGDRDFHDFLVSMQKDNQEAGHWLVKNGVDIETNEADVDKFISFNPEAFGPVIQKFENGTINLEWWNKVRFFLTENYVYTHDLDAQILVREEYMNMPGFFGDYSKSEFGALYNAFEGVPEYKYYQKHDWDTTHS